MYTYTAHIEHIVLLPYLKIIYESYYTLFYCSLLFVLNDLWDLSKLVYGFLVHSFSLLYSMPLYKYIMVYLCIPFLLDIKDISDFSGYGNQYCCEHTYTCLLAHTCKSFSIWLGMELLSHRINMSLILQILLNYSLK